MVTMTDYAGLTPTWCPGCGNFAILNALKEALIELELEPYQIVMVCGIGQAGKLPHYTKGNVLNVLHGRTLPAASGIKLANPELNVIAIGGDGDGYGEGGNHFIHTARRNHDITYLVHNNQVYGLTKGQASPTSDQGYVTKTTPYGAPPRLNPIALAIASDASFVARGFAGDVKHLTSLIKLGITHKGFALIDILQPCVSFNHRNTFGWFKERVYKLEEEYEYEPGDKSAAFNKALEWDNRIPIGIFYQKTLTAFEEHILALSKGPLVRQKVEPGKAGGLIEEFC